MRKFLLLAAIFLISFVQPSPSHAVTSCGPTLLVGPVFQVLNLIPSAMTTIVYATDDRLKCSWKGCKYQKKCKKSDFFNQLLQAITAMCGQMDLVATVPAPPGSFMPPPPDPLNPPTPEEQENVQVVQNMANSMTNIAGSLTNIVNAKSTASSQTQFTAMTNGDIADIGSEMTDMSTMMPGFPKKVKTYWKTGGCGGLSFN